MNHLLIVNEPLTKHEVAYIPKQALDLMANIFTAPTLARQHDPLEAAPHHQNWQASQPASTRLSDPSGTAVGVR